MNREIAREILAIVPVGFLLSILIVFFCSFLYAFIKRRKAKPFLDKTRQQIRLIDKVPVSHDTIRLRFELPSRDFCIGLPPGKHIKFYAPNCEGTKLGLWNGQEDRDIGNNEIGRKYTPVTGNEFCGFVDFIIKVYKKNSHPSFVDGGKMSQYLNTLQIGNTIDICGPVGLLTYHGNGVISYGTRTYKKKRFGMIAGGTGITPMLQIIKTILSNRKDSTEIYLLFANKTEEDILVRDCLEELAIHHPQQLHIWYTVDTSLKPKEWNYSIGYINEDMLKNHFILPNPDSIVLLCGPRPMIENSCRPALLQIGWPATDILNF